MTRTIGEVQAASSARCPLLVRCAYAGAQLYAGVQLTRDSTNEGSRRGHGTLAPRPDQGAQPGGSRRHDATRAYQGVAVLTKTSRHRVSRPARGSLPPFASRDWPAALMTRPGCRSYPNRVSRSHG